LIDMTPYFSPEIVFAPSLLPRDLYVSCFVTRLSRVLTLHWQTGRKLQRDV